jgi:hypothetical protein
VLYDGFDAQPRAVDAVVEHAPFEVVRAGVAQVDVDVRDRAQAHERRIVRDVFDAQRQRPPLTSRIAPVV